MPLMTASVDQLRMATSDLEHPYLLFSAADVEVMRQQLSTTHADIWRTIEAFAYERANGRFATNPPGDNQEFYRNHGNRLIPLAFTCLMLEDETVCGYTRELLLEQARWPRWDVYNQVGLGHAQMLVGTSLAYDWMAPMLSEDDQAVIRTNLIDKTERLYTASTATRYLPEYNNWWRESFYQNHYWVLNSALGMASLALAGTQDTVCTITANRNANVRSGPGLNYAVELVATPGMTFTVLDFSHDSDGYRWWHTEDDYWMREDVVNEADSCWLVDNAPTWLQHAQQRIAAASALVNTGADGTWHESIPYQNFLLTFSLMFMDSLRLNTDVDIFPHDYLRSYSDWRLYNLLANGDFILTYGNFDWDWFNGFMPHHLMRFVAAEYDDAYAEWVARTMRTNTSDEDLSWGAPWLVFEFIYYNPDIAPKPPEDKALSAYFSDLDAVIWRTSWERDAMVFGLKSGALGGRNAYEQFIARQFPCRYPYTQSDCQLNVGHDHLDTNTIYLFRDGRWLIPESVSSGSSATSNHNTIQIDRQNQYRPSFEYYDERPELFENSDGVITDRVDLPDYSYVSSDATRRYPVEDLRDVTRDVLFLRPDYFVMLDNVDASGPHFYEWIMHFREDFEVSDRWVQGLAGDDQMLGVAVVAPQEFTYSRGTNGLPSIHISPTESVPAARFLNVLWPTDSANWVYRPHVESLGDASGLIGVRVMQGRDGGYDDILMRYGSTSGLSSLYHYVFDGETAVISAQDEQSLSSLLSHGGRLLQRITADRTPQTLLQSSQPVTLQATFSGATTRIVGDQPQSGRIYSPQIDTLIINDQSVPVITCGDDTVWIGSAPADDCKNDSFD